MPFQGLYQGIVPCSNCSIMRFVTNSWISRRFVVCLVVWVMEVSFPQVVDGYRGYANHRKVTKPAVILSREEAQGAGKIIVGDGNGCGISPVSKPSAS